MRLVSSFIGSAICGALGFGIWPEMWKSYGIMGGWLAATILISIAWYMNHWLGVIDNPSGKIWVDQGFAVCSAGIAWAVVRFEAGAFAVFADVDLPGHRRGLGRVGRSAREESVASFSAPEQARSRQEGGELKCTTSFPATIRRSACRPSA